MTSPGMKLLCWALSCVFFAWLHTVGASLVSGLPSVADSPFELASERFAPLQASSSCFETDCCDGVSSTPACNMKLPELAPNYFGATASPVRVVSMGTGGIVREFDMSFTSHGPFSSNVGIRIGFKQHPLFDFSALMLPPGSTFRDALNITIYNQPGCRICTVTLRNIRLAASDSPLYAMNDNQFSVTVMSDNGVGVPTNNIMRPLNRPVHFLGSQDYAYTITGVTSQTLSPISDYGQLKTRTWNANVTVLFARLRGTFKPFSFTMSGSECPSVLGTTTFSLTDPRTLLNISIPLAIGAAPAAIPESCLVASIPGMTAVSFASTPDRKADSLASSGVAEAGSHYMSVSLETISQGVLQRDDPSRMTFYPKYDLFFYTVAALSNPRITLQGLQLCSTYVGATIATPSTTPTDGYQSLPVSLNSHSATSVVLQFSGTTAANGAYIAAIQCGGAGGLTVANIAAVRSSYNSFAPQLNGGSLARTDVLFFNAAQSMYATRVDKREPAPTGVAIGGRYPSQWLSAPLTIEFSFFIYMFTNVASFTATPATLVPFSLQLATLSGVGTLNSRCTVSQLTITCSGMDAVHEPDGSPFQLILRSVRSTSLANSHTTADGRLTASFTGFSTAPLLISHPSTWYTHDPKGSTAVVLISTSEVVQEGTNYMAGLNIFFIPLMAANTDTSTVRFTVSNGAFLNPPSTFRVVLTSSIGPISNKVDSFPQSFSFTIPSDADHLGGYYSLASDLGQLGIAMNKVMNPYVGFPGSNFQLEYAGKTALSLTNVAVPPAEIVNPQFSYSIAAGFVVSWTSMKRVYGPATFTITFDRAVNDIFRMDSNCGPNIVCTDKTATLTVPNIESITSATFVLERIAPAPSAVTATLTFSHGVFPSPLTATVNKDPMIEGARGSVTEATAQRPRSITVAFTFTSLRQLGTSGTLVLLFSFAGSDDPSRITVASPECLFVGCTGDEASKTVRATFDLSSSSFITFFQVTVPASRPRLTPTRVQIRSPTLVGNPILSSLVLDPVQIVATSVYADPGVFSLSMIALNGMANRPDTETVRFGIRFADALTSFNINDIPDYYNPQSNTCRFSDGTAIGCVRTADMSATFLFNFTLGHFRTALATQHSIVIPLGRRRVLRKNARIIAVPGGFTSDDIDTAFVDGVQGPFVFRPTMSSSGVSRNLHVRYTEAFCGDTSPCVFTLTFTSSNVASLALPQATCTAEGAGTLACQASSAAGSSVITVTVDAAATGFFVILPTVLTPKATATLSSSIAFIEPLALSASVESGPYESSDVVISTGTVTNVANSAVSMSVHLKVPPTSAGAVTDISIEALDAPDFRFVACFASKSQTPYVYPSAPDGISLEGNTAPHIVRFATPFQLHAETSLFISFFCRTVDDVAPSGRFRLTMLSVNEGGDTNRVILTAPVLPSVFTLGLGTKMVASSTSLTAEFISLIGLINPVVVGSSFALETRVNYDNMAQLMNMDAAMLLAEQLSADNRLPSTVALGALAHPGQYWCGGAGTTCDTAFPGCGIAFASTPQCYGADGNLITDSTETWVCSFSQLPALPVFDNCRITSSVALDSASTQRGNGSLVLRISYDTTQTDFNSTLTTTVAFPDAITAAVPACDASTLEEWCSSDLGRTITLRIATYPSQGIYYKSFAVVAATTQTAPWAMTWTTRHDVSGVGSSGSVETPRSATVAASRSLATKVVHGSQNLLDVFIALPAPLALPFTAAALDGLRATFDSASESAGVSCGAFISTSSHPSWPLHSSERHSSAAGDTVVTASADVQVAQIQAVLLRCTTPSSVTSTVSFSGVTLFSNTFGPIASINLGSPLELSPERDAERLFFRTRSFNGSLNTDALQTALGSDSASDRFVVVGPLESINYSATSSLGVRFYGGSSAVLAYVESTFEPLVEAFSGVDWDTTIGNFAGLAGVYGYPNGAGGYRTDCGSYDDALCLEPGSSGAVQPASSFEPCFGETREPREDGCKPKFTTASLAFTKHDDSLSLIDMTFSVDIDPQSRFVMPQRVYMIRIAAPGPVVFSAQQDDASKCVQVDTETDVRCYVAPFGEGQYGFTYFLSSSLLQSSPIRIRHTFNSNLEIRDEVTFSLDVVDNSDPAQSYLDGGPVSSVLDFPINYKDISSTTSLGISQPGVLSVSAKFSAAQAIDLSALQFSLRDESTEAAVTDCTVARIGKDAAENAAQVTFSHATCSPDTEVCSVDSDDFSYATQTSLLLVCNGVHPAGTRLALSVYDGFSRLYAGTVTAPAAEASVADHCHRAQLAYTVAQEGAVLAPSVASALAANVATFFGLAVSDVTKDVFYGATDSTMAVRVCAGAATLHPMVSGAATRWALTTIVSEFVSGALEPALPKEASFEASPSSSNGYLSVPAASVDLKCSGADGEPLSRATCALKTCSLELETPIFCCYGDALNADAGECKTLRSWPSPPVHGCVYSADDIAFATELRDDKITVDFRVIPKTEDAFALASRLTVTFAIGQFGSAVSITDLRHVSDDGKTEGSPSTGDVSADANRFDIVIKENFEGRYRVTFSSSDAVTTAELARLLSFATRTLKDTETGEVFFDSSTAFESRAWTAQRVGGAGLLMTFTAQQGLSASFVQVIAPPASLESCVAAAVGAETGATTLFIPGWSKDQAGRTAAAGGNLRFVFSQLGSSDLSTGVHLRCTVGTADVGPILVSALSEDDGLLYRAHVVTPQPAANLSGSVSYIRVDRSSVADAGEVDKLVPAWLRSEVTVSDVSGAEDDFAVTLIMAKGSQMYLLSPVALDAALASVMQMNVRVPAPYSLETVPLDAILLKLAAGSWNCDADASGSFSSACAVDNNCGASYSGDMACVSAGTAFTPSSLNAKIACLRASPPPQLPIWTGCGTLQCLNAAGDIVACDDSSVCVPGCAANVAITPAHTHEGGPLSAVCAKDGVQVSSDLCPAAGVSPPQYAQQCNATSTCGAVCSDANGVIVECGSPSSWSACSSGCGSGVQTLSYQCGDASVGASEPLPASVPHDFCGWDGSVPFETEQPCTDMSCRDSDWLCVPADNDSAAPVPCTADTFSACPTEGCARPVASRLVRCYFEGSQLVIDEHCSENKPQETKACPAVTTTCSGSWQCHAEGGAWGDCSGDDGEYGFSGQCSNKCGEGVRTRTVGCAMIMSGEVFGDISTDDVKLCEDTAGFQPTATQPCEGTDCPNGTWHCTHDESADESDCSDSGFPICPTEGCFVPVVNRTVECVSEGAVVDRKRCEDTAEPSSLLTCAPAAASCSAVFDDATCYDELGNIATCMVPGQPAPKRYGSCVDLSGDSVPNEWCDSDALEQVCQLQECPVEARWTETADEECYSSPLATCRSFIPVAIACETRLLDTPGASWQPARAEDCAALPRPAAQQPCPSTQPCANAGTCVDSTPPEGYLPGSTGVCDCPLGTSGAFCEIAHDGVLVVVTIPASGVVRVDWSLPQGFDGYDAAVAFVLQGNETRGDGLIINIDTVPALTKTLTVPARDNGVPPGEYIATVSITEQLEGESDVFSFAAACEDDEAACGEWGSCDKFTGACECVGQWSGPTCAISPCNEETCNPYGGACVVNAYGSPECGCFTNEFGDPLFTGPTCHTPVGCDNVYEYPECQNGGVRGGDVSGNDTFTCGECSCSALWEGDQCDSCSLVCYNGGSVSSSCSVCECGAKSGYTGETCSCRQMFMSFVVLASDLPFALENRTAEERKQQLLRLFSESFAYDLTHATRSFEVVPDGHATESVSKTGIRYFTLRFLLRPECETHLVGPVPDSKMLQIYNGITDVKAILTQMYTQEVALAAVPIRTLSLMHAPSGFSAFDPNCKLGAQCPSGWRNNGTFPGDESAEEEPEDEDTTKKGSSSLSTGAIIGIAVGSGIALLLLAFLAVSWAFGLFCFAAAGTVSKKETEMMPV